MKLPVTVAGALMPDAYSPQSNCSSLRVGGRVSLGNSCFHSSESLSPLAGGFFYWIATMMIKAKCLNHNGWGILLLMLTVSSYGLLNHEALGDESGGGAGQHRVYAGGQPGQGQLEGLGGAGGQRAGEHGAAQVVDHRHGGGSGAV